MADIDLNFEFEQDEYSQVTIEDVLATLRSEQEQDIDETVIYGLSGLTDVHLAKLKPVWVKLDTIYRRLLLQTLIDVSETRFELDYDAPGFMWLQDTDAEVRQNAIELLRDNETGTFMRQLLKMAQHDENTLVRAAAVRALGRFVLRGELGKLPERRNKELQENIVRILNCSDESLEVRRRAVESIANSSHKIVPEAIRMAYASEEITVRISAVTAMGRSCDDQWQDTVLHELDNPVPEMRREAVLAAGELQLEDAVSDLIEMLADDDRDVQLTVIQALGDIGTKESVRMLNKLLDAATDAEDEIMVDTIEDALGAASLVSGDMMMLDFDIDEQE